MSGDQATQPAEPVVVAVGVEIGVEAGRHRQAELARRGDRRSAERTLGGDMDDVRRVLRPEAAQRVAGGQAETQARIAGNGQAGREHLREVETSGGRFQPALARPDQLYAVAAPTQAGHQMGEGQRDAVDLGRVGFGDDRYVQRGYRAMFAGMLASHAAMLPGPGDGFMSLVLRRYFSRPGSAPR